MLPSGGSNQSQCLQWHDLCFMPRTAALGILGGFIVITADLTRLFSEVWGEFGRYMEIIPETKEEP